MRGVFGGGQARQWLAVASLLTLVACQGGQEAPTTTVLGLPDSPEASESGPASFQLEMAYFTCMEELRERAPTFEERHDRCEARVFG